MESLPVTIGHLGIVRETSVDEMLVSPDSVELAVNLNFDRIGAAQLRKGITLLGGNIATGEIFGMSNYRNNAGTVYRVLAKVDSIVYDWDESSWSSVRSALSSTSKARFTNFLDLTYMVDGNAGSAVATYNGTTFGTTNVGSLPAGDDIENFRSRIWVADSSTDKVYYTNVVSTSQTISGGTEFIQISPQDGESITGIKRHPRALLVFKQNHIYKIYSTTSADPDPAIFRGTYSKESVVEAKDGIYYHHPTGFYKFIFDGEQQEISRPISDIVGAITRANYEKVAGWSDDDHLYWSVGDITLKGVDYINIVVRYTISTQVWTLYSYPEQIKSSVLYDNGTTLRQIVGDEVGNALVFDSGNTDNSAPIFYDIQTHPLYLTNLKMLTKNVSEISVVHENAQGAEATYNVKKEVWEKIGTVRDDIVQAFTVDAKFKKIRLRLFGNSIGNSLIFRGWELLKMITEGNKKS